MKREQERGRKGKKEAKEKKTKESKFKRAYARLTEYSLALIWRRYD